MEIEYGDDLKYTDKEFLRWKKVFSKWKQRRPKDLDERFTSAHETVFNVVDCLNCANCCKTTSPIFRDVDIKRISKRLRMSEMQFESSYLLVDEDQDKVLKTSPCTFLMSDNKCGIYEDRPLACREYPHTNRKRMYQILDLTLKNTKICPAVVRIVKAVTKETI